MSTDILWQHEDPISKYDQDGDIDLPAWIDPDISPSDVAAIVQGGCDSGAYMPAVTYHEARDTMAKYGADVFDYIEHHLGDPVDLFVSHHQAHGASSWDGMACYFVSVAVELWAAGVEDPLADLLAEREAA